jgi:hypothetical protein
MNAPVNGDVHSLLCVAPISHYDLAEKLQELPQQ